MVKTLFFDDIIKNIRNNEEFSKLVESIILNGEKMPFNHYDIAIELGVTFGILSNEKTTDGNYTKIFNKIFETLLYNLYINKKLRLELRSKFNYERNQFTEDGKINMEMIILKFQEFIKKPARTLPPLSEAKVGDELRSNC